MALARKSQAGDVEIKGAIGPGYEQVLSSAALDFVAERYRGTRPIACWACP